MSDKLSVIVIQLDSLNRHFLPTYGCDWIKVPVLTDFARRSAVFNNHFTGSLPCMPARREIWAGTEEFWWRGWGPLEPWDQPIAYLARQSGITSQLITDHYHFFEWGSHSFYHDFDGYEFIRGHELDNWRTKPLNSIPAWAERMVDVRGEHALTYLRNVQDFQGEADFFAPKVMSATADWLDENHELEQFYLHVDCFDVHEPFHVPEPYLSMYTDADPEVYNPWPRYGRVDRGSFALSEDEIAWIRAQFAGKLTMVDTWLERVFDRLERYDLLARTCVIISTDHGHYLGENGWMGKPDAPLYHTLCHIPLIVWHPAGAHNGAYVDATTQTVDLYATTLDLLGITPLESKHIHSRSFAPILTGQRTAHRDYAVYGYANKLVGITQGDWTLLRSHEISGDDAYIYTHNIDNAAWMGWQARQNRSYTFDTVKPVHLPGIDLPVWQVQMDPHVPGESYIHPDHLFNNATDSRQEINLTTENADVLSLLEDTLRSHATALRVPDEQFKRLRL